MARSTLHRAVLPRAHRLLLVGLAALTLGPAPSAEAVPLRIRAEARLEVRTERRADGLVLSGRLSDDREAPLPGESVLAEVEGLGPQSVTSGHDGRFELLIGARDVRSLATTRGQALPWTLRYEGSATFGPAHSKGRLDLKREPTWVDVEVDPPVATLDTDAVTVHVALRAASGPVGRVSLQLQVADGPELIGDTDESGAVIFLIRPDALPRAGTFDVRASWLGDHRYAPSDAAARLRVLRPTRLTLRVGREGDLRTGRYRFSGRLSDDRGAVPGAAVALVVRDIAGEPDSYRSETVVTTDSDGVYLVAIDASAFSRGPPGTLELRAVYRPVDDVHGAASSRAARIPAPGPPGVPLSWYLAALAASLGLVLLALAIRLRFWREVAAAWRRWRDRKPAPPTDDEIVPALVLEPGQGKDLRPDWLAGRVIDAHTGRGVVGAHLLLDTAEGGRVDARTGPRGAFEVGPVPAGAWRLALAAPGYLPRRTRIALPHDGSLDGATLALVAVRGRVKDLFAQALRRAGVLLRWGLDTPTEAARAAALPDDDGRAALDALRTLVERSWFAPGIADVSEARRAEELLEAVRGAPDEATGDVS